MLKTSFHIKISEKLWDLMSWYASRLFYSFEQGEFLILLCYLKPFYSGCLDVKLFSNAVLICFNEESVQIENRYIFALFFESNRISDAWKLSNSYFYLFTGLLKFIINLEHFSPIMYIFCVSRSIRKNILY